MVRPNSKPHWTDKPLRYLPDDQTGCWVFQGTIDSYGYGVLQRGGKPAKAHRVAWQEHVGPIPEGLCVCHRCDNPPCVNPMHLFLGTARDNAVDRARKGRQRTKLQPPQVQEIRTRQETGESMVRLAHEFGVSVPTIHSIIHRKKWRHI